MQLHPTGIHSGAGHHHSHEIKLLREEYQMHPGRWLLDHPMLPVLVVSTIIMFLLVILTAAILSM